MKQPYCDMFGGTNDEVIALWTVPVNSLVMYAGVTVSKSNATEQVLVLINSGRHAQLLKLSFHIPEDGHLRLIGLLPHLSQHRTANTHCGVACNN